MTRCSKPTPPVRRARIFYTLELRQSSFAQTSRASSSVDFRGRAATAEAEKTASARLVDSVALTLTARAAMIVVLPVAIWIGNRGISTIDEISKKLDKMKEASIEQTVEVRVQARHLADHEARVRVLEAAGRVTTPIGRP